MNILEEFVISMSYIRICTNHYDEIIIGINTSNHGYLKLIMNSSHEKLEYTGIGNFSNKNIEAINDINKIEGYFWNISKEYDVVLDITDL